MHEKYSAPPEPIDWTSYKEFFANHPEIIKVEQDFKSFTVPTHHPADTAAIRERMEPSVGK